MTQEHILILGASGQGSIALIDEVLKKGNEAPLITLYIRSSGRSKLPNSITDSPNFRLMEGALDDRASLVKALSASSVPAFPQVTTVISFLGAYMSAFYFFTRQTPTPIADAINTSVLPAMKEVGVRRIFALSTINGFCYPAEMKHLTWSWTAFMLFPKLVVPQANAEMHGIANALIVGGASDPNLEWTIFRVSFLDDGPAELKVSAGQLGDGFNGSLNLSRKSLARWLLGELAERRYVRRAVLLGNTS